MKIKIIPADKYFSLCVRERAENKCERCGSEGAMQCCHYQGRGAWETRFLPENCFCLDMGCHAYLDGHKIQFKEFYIQKRGQAAYDMLVEKSHDVELGKQIYQNKKEIAIHYHDEYLSMLLKRSYGLTGWLEFVGWS